MCVVKDSGKTPVIAVGDKGLRRSLLGKESRERSAKCQRARRCKGKSLNILLAGVPIIRVADITDCDSLKRQQSRTMGNQEMLIVAGLILTFWITIYHPFMVAVLIILLLWCLSHPNEVKEFFGNLTSSPNGVSDSNAPRMTTNNKPTHQSDPVYTQVERNKFAFDPSKFQFNNGKSIMEQSVLPDDPSMSPSFYSENNTETNPSDARGNGLFGSILERAVDNKAAADPPRRKKSQREILAELAEEEERRKKYEKLLLTMQVPQMTDYFQEIINYEN